MQIAELFIGLGIKGSEKTLNALSYVKTGIDNVTTTSLEAKAAILGAVYALEQLTSGAARDGAHIENLASYLNISTEALQKWNYAAQQGNISNQEFESSLVSIQQKINAFATSHNLPEGATILAQQTHFDFTKPFKSLDLLEALLKFSQNKNYSKEKISTILSNFGLSQNEIGAAFAGKFNAANVRNAPFQSNKTIKDLADVNKEWANLETKTKLFFGNLTGEHGKDAVKTVSMLADSFFRLANDVDRIATHLGLFKLLGEIFKVVGKGIDFTSTALEEGFEGKYTPEQKKQFEENYKKLRQEQLEDFNRKPGSVSQLTIDSIQNILGGITEFKNDLFGKSIAPNFTDRFSLPQSNTKPPDVNLTMNFQHDGREIIPLKNDVQTAVIQACKMFTANIRTT